MSDAKPAPPSTGRIEAFSDGVIAIIITIMILELKIPFREIDATSLIGVIGEIGAPLLSYVLSFVVVAILLLNHHEMMRIAPYATPGLYWWNAHLLLWTSLIPLSTATMGNHPFAPAAVAFYGLILAGVSVAFTLLHRYLVAFAIRTGGANPRPRLEMAKDYAAMVLYGSAAALAFVSVYLSFAIYLLVPVAYFLPSYNHRQTSVKG